MLSDVSKKNIVQNTTSKHTVSPSRISRLLDRAGNVIPLTSCLSKALAGSILFSSSGYQTKLHIGVKREESGVLGAHAWLTLDGCVVTGKVSDLNHYQELPSLSHLIRNE